MHFLQAINNDLSVLIVCNKTGGTIKGDIKKIQFEGRKFDRSIFLFRVVYLPLWRKESLSDSYKSDYDQQRQTYGVCWVCINPYPTAFPYGNGIVLHFYQQQESSTTKTVHKVINKGLKTYVYSPHTGENFH